MSIVPLVVPDDDTLTIESPDWAIPCGYVSHARLGSGPASYAVWSTPKRPCGCPIGHGFEYICSACWAALLRAGCYCPECYAQYDVMETVSRVERI